MAALSSGKKLRSTKVVKSGTSSKRKHRFESFNQRVSKLNIDPIHKTRHPDRNLDEDESTASYFKADLDKWRDLNLSENFSSFVREVSPWCNTLPQVLHYQRDIARILATFIEKGDPHSLEPLLSLLACLAHDLGSKFEIHFSDAVALVTSLAAKHAEVEVIEWSFNCLAWLFKYLSRLLVPDLRPLLRVLSPLLGKEPQKMFITRFAAESLSFLLRKAALVYHKNQKPLHNAVSFVLEDVDQLDRKGKDVPLYFYGLKILFVDAIKGIDRGFHSSGPTLYGFLVDSILSEISEVKGRLRLLEGVTVGLIHHSDASAFRPLMEHCLQRMQQDTEQERNSQAPDSALQVCERLLCVLSTVRKGSRVSDWAPMLDTLVALLKSREDHDDKPTQALCETAVVIMQSAPLDVLIPKVRPAMDRIVNKQNQDQFLVFCHFFCQLDRERFESLIHPYFVKFLNSQWQSQRRQLCLTLPEIAERGSGNKVVCPASWQNEIVACFALAERSGEEALIAECWSYIRVLDHLAVSESTTDAIMNVLYSLIETTLKSPDQVNPKSIFSLGEGLKAYAEYESKHGGGRLKIWQSTLNAAQYYMTLPSFLGGVLISMSTDELSFDARLDGFMDHVIENLQSSSNILRQLSLRIISTAYTKLFGNEAEILATALAIESLPLDLKSARTISMYVRKLASQYKEENLHHWIRKAVPHFCFGIQTYKLSSIWDDAIEVLKQICEAPHGEELVSDLAFQSLEVPSCQDDNSETVAEQPHKRMLDEFECSNLSDIDRGFYNCVTELEHPEEKIIKIFWDSHTLSRGTASNRPAIALRVLLGIPNVAEKQSRRLVPVFLRWAVVCECEHPSQASNQTGDADVPKLSGQDRKAMLRLFGLFNNPKVLYRSADVFDALRSLLAHGDVEMQKPALKAILTWKSEALQPYQESLLNLLDDSRFRDEIATFLHSDDQGSKIQKKHRSQLMPVLLRLLYGKLISRTGDQNAKRTQSVKRKVILETLARFDDTEIREFLSIAFGSVDKLGVPDVEGYNTEVATKGQLPQRRQVGLLHMVRDLLHSLGVRLKPFTRTVVGAVISPTVEACQVLALEKAETDDREGSRTSLLKNIRQMGLQCITLLFQHCTIGEIQPYIPTMFAELINPRLESLPIDTAQSVSGLLQLFSTWASSRQTASFLVEYNPALLESISRCLNIEFAKDEVKTFVLEGILKSLIGLIESEPGQSHDVDYVQMIENVLHPNINVFLVHLGGLLRKSPSKELLASAIDCVTRLAPFVQESFQTRNILELASFLLTQPSPRVSPRTKGDLLQILQHLMPQHNFLETPDLQEMIFTTISSLFGYFKDRNNRVTLVQVFLRLADKDKDQRNVAELCRSLNSYAVDKVDEPDFDARLQAFNAINEHEFDKLTPREWRPILYNMLFFIRDTEELAIRSSASFTLRRFVEANLVNAIDDVPASSDLTQNVLLPALRKGASETSELVRTEYLAVMAHMVRLNTQWHEVSDMGVLLVADDEEASFFNNILHIQQHRRLRACRRLATEARNNRLHSKNIAHFFLPLIEHFVFDKAEDESAHNLCSEAVMTIGALALSMEWPQFRAVFRRYLGYVESKRDLEKTMIRLVGVLANSLSSIFSDEKETLLISNEEDPAAIMQRHTTLANSLPGQQKLAQDLTENLLPALTKYLHEKDESTVSLRVPVAVSAVKLLKMLPRSDVADRLPPILTDVCNILRSRAQESRDLTRKTLVDIAVVAGPAYFGFLLKELRRALTRGYQLHVLSYTVHSILVATGAVFKHGDLDYCLSQIVAVIMDDTFGATGEEKDAEEYISKMKEVKSSKSYDSMEIVARSATAENFLELIRPLQSLLNERLDLKAVRKIDELLRRIGLGLLHNETIESRQVLVFCHEIIREVYKSGEEPGNRASRQDSRNKRFLVNVTGAQKSQRGSTSSSRHKLIRFAFDLLRSVLHRFDSLQTPANLAGFMPMLGDAVLQPNEEIRMSAIRLLTTIIRVPLQEIDNNAAIYVTESIKVVKASPATNTELSQAALKLVSAILRERRDVEVREIDLAYLLKRIQPDLEELDRQGVAFNLLKAVMNRKIVIVEVYEVLETVASMMITNQTRGARDQARGVYFDFLINYPQGKGRFSKQLAFLLKNLEYKHPDGRQSVMEAIHLLLSKMSADLVQSILKTCFVPLVMVVVNDESLPCREMAGALLKVVVERSDAERSEAFLAMLRTWLSQSKQPLLMRVALQVYGVYFDTQKARAAKELSFLFGQLAQVLQANLMSAEDADWELLYYALQTFTKACQMYSNVGFSANTATIWTCVRQCISFPHLWVKLSAAKLQGMLFADIARTNAGNDEPGLPLKGSGGLQLSGPEMEQTTRASLPLLKVPMLNEELATQAARNLVFLAKMMNKTSWEWGRTEATMKLPDGEEVAGSEDGSSETEVESQTQSGLAFILQRASAIPRRGPLTTREPSLVPVKAALQLLWALCSNLPTEALRPNIRTVLLPLQNLTDPSIPPPFSNDEGFVKGYKALVSHGSEIMAMLQKKFGTNEYIMHLRKVREGIKERREDRRVKRRIEAVAEPAKMGRLKRRKGEKKKEKRKEKSAGQRSMRRGW